MTQRRISWTVQALRRLDEIGAYIEKDDPDAAARMIARLVASVDMLAELPAAGRITGTRAPADQGRGLHSAGCGAW